MPVYQQLQFLGPENPLASVRTQTISAWTQSFTAERESGGASVSGRGVPVKVHVHRKAYKDLSDLHLIQEIHSHVGVALLYPA